MRPALTSILICFFSCSCIAQIAQVADINTGTGHSYPGPFAEWNNKLFFPAETSSEGRELWQYDGVNPPDLCFDLAPGAWPGVYSYSGLPVTVLGNKMYFNGNNTTNSSIAEMFSYDGMNPPQQVTNLTVLGWGNQGAEHRLAYNNRIYFTWNENCCGTQLWDYNPVNDSVIKRTNIFLLTGGVNGPMFPYKGKIYFAARQGGAYGLELWSYDTATHATTMIDDINPGSYNSSPRGFLEANGKLYFSATDGGSSGYEIYEYDGVSLPQKISNIGGGGMYSNFTLFQNKFVFSADDLIHGPELFTMDTMTHVSALVADIRPGSAGSDVWKHIVYGNKLYFPADDGVHGSELWVWDGISSPYMVADFNPGTVGLQPYNFSVFQNKLYFEGYAPSTGVELYEFYDTNLSLSLNNIKQRAGLRVYPIPADDDLMMEITLAKECELAVSINDVNGRSVYSIAFTPYCSGSNSINCDIRSLSPGTYFMSVRDRSGRLLSSSSMIKE